MLLALRALNLGDLLVAVPALRALRGRYPEHRLVLATNPSLGPVVELLAAVDGHLPHRGLQPPDLSLADIDATGPGPAVDIAVDLHGVLPESIQCLEALRPRQLVAFACPEIGRLAGPPAALDQPEHEVDRWLRLVASVGAQGDRDDLHLPMPPGSNRDMGYVIVHPGAAYGSKRWPLDRFASVAAELQQRTMPVLVTGNESEQILTAELVRRARLPHTADLGGQTHLRDLLRLIAGARLVITGDTGVAHIATAFRTPSVVLFGPASPRLWGPPESGPHIALWHGDDEHEVLVDEPDPALLSITVDEVLEAAHRALATPRRSAFALL